MVGQYMGLAARYSARTAAVRQQSQQNQRVSGQGRGCPSIKRQREKGGGPYIGGALYACGDTHLRSPTYATPTLSYTFRPNFSYPINFFYIFSGINCYYSAYILDLLNSVCSAVYRL